ncbi:MAG: hypothetical protein ACKO34_03785 [Vampirovibrionales bacterium]
MSLPHLFDSVLLHQLWHLEGWSLALLAWVLPTVVLIGVCVLLSYALGYVGHGLQLCYGTNRLAVEMFQTLWHSESLSNTQPQTTQAHYQQLHQAVSLSFQATSLNETETVCLLMVALCQEMLQGHLHWSQPLTQHLSQRLKQEDLLQAHESQATALILADILSQARRTPSPALQH